ncbi:MAG: UvrD-helicase domain-containing protein [Lautropia sp.]|nr:UvrD-helicase domain-containing protein [Lautropia sp.]
MSEMGNDGTARPVRALDFPLHGSQLIEASAGTGKTFTIAALYVRLVLGHGADNAFGAPQGRPLDPPEILVVTFTEAATLELRDRIRARLAEAARFFRAGEAEAARGDEFLQQLRDSYPPGRWADAAGRLQLAAEWMDEAAVSTIHGWCSRMLREHAFDSGASFLQKQVEDDAALLTEAIRDYWRSFVQQLDATQAQVFSQWWKGFDTFAEEMARDQHRLRAVAGEALLPLAAVQQTQSAVRTLKAGWQGGVLDELEQHLQVLLEEKALNGVSIKAVSVTNRMAQLRAWLADEAALLPVNDRGEHWLKRSSGKHDSGTDWVLKWAGAEAQANPKVWKKPDKARPELMEKAEALALALQERGSGAAEKAAVCRHAARWIAARHRQAREQRGELNFDDLLQQLDEALQGEGGPALARRIRQQFPAALIDEFQDTDPLQYRIFDSIYQVAANDAQTALVLIGDPKQAIYAFRDADIYTYLKAREATRGRHHTLAMNYRSSQAMVGAVNTLFAAAEARASAGGAFRFAREGHNPVPFVPVEARGRGREVWQDPAQPVGQTPALTIWMPSDDDADLDLSSGAYVRRFAAACAQEIARLLGAGHPAGHRGEDPSGIGAGSGDGQVMVAKPADIAVLVNTGHQASQVRRALRRHGIPSVYLSDKASVFESGLADDVLRFLAACAEPERGQLLRAALGSALAGLSMAGLLQLQQDERAWEAQLARFQGYRQVWRRRGVLPMIRQVLQDFGVAERLLAQGNERDLADVLHLSELLQQASGLLDGEQALIRFLREQRERPEGDAASRKQRLESDEARVRVVTVHKSKGLEYPLVFLPFFCDARVVRDSAQVLSWHDADGQPRHMIAAGASAEALAEAVKAADEERLAEDLRKLYVALTRARHATWVGMDAVKGLGQSAAGHLLGVTDVGAAAAAGSDGLLSRASGSKRAGKKGGQGDADRKAEADEKVREARRQLWAALQERVAQAPPGQMVLRTPPLPDPGLHWQPQRRAVRWKTPPALPAERWPAWWIASYSALEVDGAGRMVGTHASSRAQAGPGHDLNRQRLAESAREDDWREYLADGPPADEPQADAPAVGAAASIHDFPRGPRPGTFLHGLLEWAGRQGFAQLAAEPALLGTEIARRLHHQPQWQPWRHVLGHWLQRLLTQPLHGLDTGLTAAPRLGTLVQYQVEMSFLLAVGQLDVAALDGWVCRHTLGGAVRPALQPGQLNGMLKGFIDLVFEHEGRYYVLDYKSNWLGADDAAYQQPGMQAAVLSHRYELQYLFYLLALHRLLRARLPDYDYDRHVGGALYLFLRGVDAASGGVFHARPARAVIEALDAAFAGDAAMLHTTITDEGRPASQAGREGAR